MYEPCDICGCSEGRYEREVDGKRRWLCALCWQSEEHQAERDRTIEDLTRGHADSN